MRELEFKWYIDVMFGIYAIFYFASAVPIWLMITFIILFSVITKEKIDNHNNRKMQLRSINGISNRTMISKSKQELIQKIQNNTNDINIAADGIKKYKELYDMGAISKEEYDAQKNKLLNIDK